MYSASRIDQTQFSSLSGMAVSRPDLYIVEGTLQRINSRQQEFTVVAEGRLWRFAIPGDCLCWFDGWKIPWRCMVPLSHVHVVFEVQDEGLAAREVYGWEPQPTPVS